MTPESAPQKQDGVNQSRQATETSRREFRTILLETLPCWHELSWDAKGPALVLRIHQNYTDAIRIKPDAPIVLGFQKTFDLGGFEGDLEGNFGFNEALKNQGEKDGFYQYSIELPTIKVTTDTNCDRCDGMGRDADYDEDCIRCQGGGKEIRYDWKRAHEISTSLNILTLRLPSYDHDVSTHFPQLITFEASGSPKNSAVFGEISIPLRNWLSSNPDHSVVPEAVTAMKDAYMRMFGARMGLVEEHRFEMRIENNGGLIASCPGDACGIHPENWNFTEGRGYEFSSHNVDTPMQQLTLLAGLAALHDIARREIPR